MIVKKDRNGVKKNFLLVTNCFDIRNFFHIFHKYDLYLENNIEKKHYIKKMIGEIVM